MNRESESPKEHLLLLLQMNSPKLSSRHKALNKLANIKKKNFKKKSDCQFPLKKTILLLRIYPKEIGKTKTKNIYIYGCSSQCNQSSENVEGRYMQVYRNDLFI